MAIRIPNTVLMTTDTVGGVWIYALELAGALADRGVRTVLAAMGEEPSGDQRRAANAVRGLRLVCRTCRLEWMGDAWEDVESAGEWLIGLEAAYRPDLIHLNNYAHGALPWSAPVLMVGHSCVYSWFHAVHRTPPPRQWTEYHGRVAAGLRAAGAVTAPTRTMLLELERHYGAFTSVGAVYNARRVRMGDSRRREPVIFTAGRLWDEAKNVNVLDVAAREIRWPVFAAGAVKNPDGGTIRFDAIRLLGTLPPHEVTRWMRESAIYALPARYEPFGLTALEAAYAGCALVLGDIPSLREIWRDAALFVSPDQPGELVRALNRLIEDPGFRDEMARRASRRATAFTMDRMTDAYLRIYSGLLSGTNAAIRPPTAASANALPARVEPTSA